MRILLGHRLWSSNHLRSTSSQYDRGNGWSLDTLGILFKIAHPLSGKHDPGSLKNWIIGRGIKVQVYQQDIGMAMEHFGHSWA